MIETALDRLETKIIHFTDNIQKIEKQELYKTILEEKIKSSPSKKNPEKQKMEFCWLNNFLKKYKAKKRVYLNSQLIQSYGDLTEFADESINQLSTIIEQKNKKYLIELIKTLIKISTRQNLILKNLEDFFEYNLEEIRTQFEEQLEENMVESTSIIEEMQNKIIFLEEKLKIKNLDDPLSEEFDPKNGKKDKKIEKLKNKIESLLKKNSNLKLKINTSKKKNLKKQKKVTGRKDKMESKFKENLVLAKSKSKEPNSKKQKKGKLQNIIPQQGKKKEIANYDNLIIHLIKFNSIFSQNLVKSKKWLKEIFYEPVYTTYLEMVVEFIPLINKKREILLEEPAFVKGILELFYKLISNSNLVHFDQLQIWIGKPDVLPLNFKPKSKYWIKYLKGEKKKNEKEDEEENEEKPFENCVVGEEISTHLKSLLIGLADFLKLKLGIFIGLGKKIREIGVVNFDQKENKIKSKEVNSNMKSLGEIMNLRMNFNQILILSYMICRKIGYLGDGEEDFYDKGIREIFENRVNWEDCPKIEEYVKQWYKGVGGDVGLEDGS